MAINIKSTHEIHQEGIKCVIYGESGVGKTVLCSTAPKPLIISAESGLLSLSSKHIDYIEIRSIRDIGDAYSFAAKSDYSTICLDSLSEIAEVCLTAFKKDVADGRQAYMKLSEHFGALIRNFRDLRDKDVVFIAKQKRITDEESGSSHFEPYLPGQVLPFNLPYLVDEVFCMRMSRKGERYLQTSADRRYVAKDRSGKLSSEEKPNLTELFQIIRN